MNLDDFLLSLSILTDKTQLIQSDINKIQSDMFDIQINNTPFTPGLGVSISDVNEISIGQPVSNTDSPSFKTLTLGHTGSDTGIINLNGITNNGSATMAKIVGLKNAVTDEGELLFYTKTNTGHVTEKLKINGDGAIGIDGKYGNDNEVLVSKGADVPPVWTTLPDNTYSEGKGVTISGNTISIGQDVGINSNVSFNVVNGNKFSLAEIQIKELLSDVRYTMMSTELWGTGDTSVFTTIKPFVESGSLDGNFHTLYIAGYDKIAVSARKDTFASNRGIDISGNYIQLTGSNIQLTGDGSNIQLDGSDVQIKGSNVQINGDGSNIQLDGSNVQINGDGSNIQLDGSDVQLNGSNIQLNGAYLTVIGNDAMLSDDRLKDNERSIPDVYDKISSLNIQQYTKYLFDPKTGNRKENGFHEYGIIAQDILNTDLSFCVHKVSYGENENPEDFYYTIVYRNLFCLNMEATKRLIQEVTTLKEKVTTLEQQVASSQN